MVDRILRALHPPLENQKLFRGGIPRAIAAIEAAVNEGKTFGVEIDFVDFYASIGPEALPDLLRPLPATVVDAVVWDSRSRHSQSGDPAFPIACSSSVPNGLSLGSACSPIVGEIIIASLLRAARLDDVVTFADNLFVLGRSEENVRAKIQTLRDVVREQSFGTLEVRQAKQRGFKLCYPFEFAKHAGILRNGEIRWSPSVSKLGRYDICAVSGLRFDETVSAEKKVSHWRRAYPFWEHGDAFEAEYRAAIAARRFYLSRNPTLLRQARDAVLIAYYERRAIEPDFPGGFLYFVPAEGDILGDAHGRLVAAITNFVRSAHTD